MLRVTTLHASSAVASASYYAQYLTAAPGEVPGVWSGRQAVGLGLSGRVDVDALELLLSGRDPVTGTRLGRELLDRFTADGRVVRAVSGFDATFSAPKSLSVWWALTGDDRLLEAHDVAVAAALQHLERFGSTTRIRSDGGRLHPDAQGLTIAAFRQTTSRADDPQIHTHAVISAKVQTAEGRWLALDARYLKRHQRMLGGVYQSVLRAELTHRFGVEWGPMVTGQAEIAGVPDVLLDVFSKRSAAISVAMAAKLEEFRQREGRGPSRFERAALEREASADTRSRKSGHGAADLATRWRTEAADVGWSIDRLGDEIVDAARHHAAVDVVKVDEVVEAVSAQRSSWGRPDVVQAICDVQRPVSQMSGRRWHDAIERSADRVVEHLVDLDPPDVTLRRKSDRRSLWIEPTAPRFTSEAVLAQEEDVITWAMAAQADPAIPSTTVDRSGLDALQAEAAASVAGHDDLVLGVGPAGAGKTRMLAAAANDLCGQGRVVFGVAPTAKAARTLGRDTGIPSDTVAKLLHEWQRSDRPPLPDYQLGAGATVIVDEAGMLSTPALHQIVSLASSHRWRLALVGDPRQLQGVGRGGLLAELCANGRVDPLERLHRFTHRWEAAASLLVRCGDRRAFDAYEAHGRIVPGTLDEHLTRMADTWIANHRQGRSAALVASTNDHVDAINHAIQQARLAAGDLDPDTTTPIGAGERAHLGDIVATRRNDRRLTTSAGEPVRNRDTWTVTGIGHDGSITVSHQGGHGTVTLPADYAREHVRLGYAATAHGWESDTVSTAMALASTATTRRGLYVAVTRGRDENMIFVITDSDDVAEARDILDGIVAVDRADIPAVTQRRTLAQQQPRQHDVPTTTTTTTTSARCIVPEWFTPLLHEARLSLAAAEERHTARAAQRQRLVDAAAGADRATADVAAATAPDRDAHADAAARADVARRLHAAARGRLDAAPFRHRRSARHDLDIAERQLARAEDYLERTRQRTEPSLERYRHAQTRQRDAHDNLRHGHTADMLDAMQPSVDDHRRRVTALETWQRWATGGTVQHADLQQAVDTLINTQHSDRSLTMPLAHSLQQRAKHHHVELDTSLRHELAAQPPGPELEL
jgi:conjugative relaxase-like TrwC/TraI family protein